MMNPTVEAERVQSYHNVGLREAVARELALHFEGNQGLYEEYLHVAADIERVLREWFEVRQRYGPFREDA